MLKHLVHRLIGILPVLLLIPVVVFAFVHLLPGDPACLAAGQDASAEDIAAVRSTLGLDCPLWEQYFTYLGNVLQVDFGMSLKTRRPVSVEIGERFFPTLWLAAIAASCALGGAPRGRTKRAKDIALGAAAVINLLLRALSWPYDRRVLFSGQFPQADRCHGHFHHQV